MSSEGDVTTSDVEDMKGFVKNVMYKLTHDVL